MIYFCLCSVAPLQEELRGTVILQPQAGMSVVRAEHTEAGADGVLAAVVTLTAVGQVLPDTLLVNARITPNTVAVSPVSVALGRVGMQETSVTTVTLTNHGAVAREFGFVGYPDYVSVQPNGGCGSLMPYETVTLHLLVSPEKAEIGQHLSACLIFF
jgi:hypothetical protein